MKNELKHYYEEIYEEDGRLRRTRGHQIEYLTTVHYFDKIFTPRSRILDVCAGTGEYALYLAEQGHDVFACDLMEKHVDIMRARPGADKLAGYQAADAMDLSDFEDNSYDIVLCMGALYHLHEAAEREKAVAECLRVLKPGGIFVFSYVTRNGAFIAELCRSKSFGKIADLANIFKTGNYGVFYLMDFGEAQKLADKFELEKIVEVGTNVLRYPLADWLNNADDADFEAYVAYHLATCEEPSILGNSPNCLWIGRKIH